MAFCYVTLVLCFVGPLSGGIGPFQSYVPHLLKGKFTGSNKGLKVQIWLDSERPQTNNYSNELGTG